MIGREGEGEGGQGGDHKSFVILVSVSRLSSGVRYIIPCDIVLLLLEAFKL